MRQIRHIIKISFILFSGLFFLSSCSKKTPNEFSKDIQKNSDSLSHKLNRDADTLVNKFSANDSLFTAVKPEQVDVSKLPSKDFRKKNNDIFSKYTDIKNSLVKDDSAGVQKSVKDMHQSFLDAMSESSKEKISDAPKSSSKLEKIIEDIQNANTLDNERSLFNDLTMNMVEFMKVYGLYDNTIYILSCDNKSGKPNNWLVDKKNTDNPYYGKNKTNEKSVPCAKVTKAWKFD